MSCPPCFNGEEEFRQWVRYARQSQPPPADSYCFDCTEQYRDKMIAENRCEFPDTSFITLSTKLGHRTEFEVVGKRNRKHIIKIRNEVLRRTM